MAIRFYHLAPEMKLSAGDLWKQVRARGLDLPSIMTILDDAQTETVRRVARGEVKIAEKPKPGEASEIKLPPPVVPAPARTVRPAPQRPAAKRPVAPQRTPQSPRRGIKIFKQKDTRDRRSVDRQRGEEIFTGRTIPIIVPIALKDFSQQIGVKTNTLLLHLMKQRIMANPNTSLDEETVLVLAEAFNRTVEVTAEKTVEAELEQILETREAKAEEQASTRPAIVAVLGHVDHGKTSLLDHIRNTRVAAGEAGGITQHIGAYQVPVTDRKWLTFLDTPGHEAFTAMRARGAQLTDIVILVCAADDGVMPQTEEAISHAKAAGVPIVVAVNKIDKADAQPDKARQQLAGIDLAPEEWGGDVAMINCSAITGEGIDKLLERVALEAEILDLRASPESPAEGYVVEARKHSGKGVVATLLIKNGTLRRGDYVLSGTTQGKVKSLMDEQGKLVKAAGPSMPVEVTGLEEVPEAGWRFQVLRDKGLAKKVASERSHRQREIDLAARAHTSTFEKLMTRMGSQDVRELRLVVKADVKGSLEALRGKIEKLGNEEVGIKILHSGVGGVTESDIQLAQVSDGIVLAFHVLADAKARRAADAAGVEIRTYQIIYELLEDLHKAVEGLLPKETAEIVLGHAEIRQLFKHRKRNIAGCMVTDGVARRDAHVRLTRDGRVILNDGRLDSLRRFKDDAKEVKEGFDCGIMLIDYEDVKQGDIFEFYTTEERTRTL